VTITQSAPARQVGDDHRLPPAARALILIRDQGLAGLWVILVIGFSITGPHFFSTATGVSILNSAAITSIFAAGLGIGVMTGVLDLSVPGTAAVAGVVVGLLMNDGLPVWLCLMAGMAVGVVVGAVNGYAVIQGFDPLIVTIGMLSMLSGLALVLTGGLDVSGLGALAFLGTRRSLGIPSPVYVSVLVFVVLTVVLKFTRAGMRLLAVGGNSEAARRVGINVGRYRILGFVISGVCAAIGGVVNAAYISIATPTASTAVIFQALTSVALAGVPFVGGRGSLPRVFLGGVVLATISAGLLSVGVQTYWATITTGALLIAALAMQLWTTSAISNVLVAGREAQGAGWR
jgi:ribose transport system permease protein